MASIYKPKGSTFWWIAFYRDKVLYRRSLKTKDYKVAKYHKNQIENELAKGQSPLPPSDLKARDCLDEYIKYSLPRRTRVNVNTDERRIGQFLQHCRIAKLAQIKPKHIEDFLHHRQEAGKVGLNTLNHIIASLRTWLNWAKHRGYIVGNPADKIAKYKLPKNPPRFLSKDDISRILKAAKGNNIYPMIATALYTGVRANELINLEWQDFDFDKGVLTVVNKDGFQTKSRKFRAIPLHKHLIKLLRPYRQQNGLCFTGKRGKRLRAAPRKSLATILKKAEVKKVGWHNFRHSFASHLIMSGVDIVTVSKLLGHSKIETTMIYSHLTEGHKQEAINKLAF